MCKLTGGSVHHKWHTQQTDVIRLLIDGSPVFLWPWILFLSLNRIAPDRLESGYESGYKREN